MTYLRGAFLFVFGMASGGMVAAGVFAFIIMVGIFTRLSSRTRTSAYTSLYENMIVLGGTLGNIMLVFGVRLPLYMAGVVLFGAFSGIFVGCLAMALAEVLNVFPVLVKRVGIVQGLPYVVMSVAIGKAVGSYVQFYYLLK